MSYFNPSEDINSIFLDFQQQEYYYGSQGNKIDDLKLEVDLSFKIQEFTLDLFDHSYEKDIKIQEGVQIYDRNGMGNKSGKSRYEKNICGYIVKKILRAFISPSYQREALSICQKFNVEFQELRCFCLQKMEKLNGISCLYSVFMPGRKEDIESRLALLEFTEWFVKERYLRHLIFEGKMKNKESYIYFKNKLFPREVNCLKMEIAIYKQELRAQQ